MFQRLRIFSGEDILSTMFCQSKHITSHRNCKVLIEKLSDFFLDCEIWCRFEEGLSSAKLTLSSEKLIKEGFRFEYGISEMYDEMTKYFESKGLIKP